MPHLFARFVITNTKTPKQSLTSVFSISCTLIVGWLSTQAALLLRDNFTVSRHDLNHFAGN